jgi:hypothetical protein
MSSNEHFGNGAGYDSSVSDPFEVLGVPRDADVIEIKKAYRRLARERHPDFHPDLDETDMKNLNVAKELANGIAKGEIADPDGRLRAGLAEAMARALGQLRPAFPLEYQQMATLNFEDMAPGVSVQEVRRAA